MNTNHELSEFAEILHRWDSDDLYTTQQACEDARALFAARQPEQPAPEGPAVAALRRILSEAGIVSTLGEAFYMVPALAVEAARKIAAAPLEANSLVHQTERRVERPEAAGEDLEGLKRDAARYRCLRGSLDMAVMIPPADNLFCYDMSKWREIDDREALDAHIDAAVIASANERAG